MVINYRSDVRNDLSVINYLYLHNPNTQIPTMTLKIEIEVRFDAGFVKSSVSFLLCTNGGLIAYKMIKTITLVTKAHPQVELTIFLVSLLYSGSCVGAPNSVVNAERNVCSKSGLLSILIFNLLITNILRTCAIPAFLIIIVPIKHDNCHTLG